MKNSLSLALVGFVLLVCILGCSKVNPFSDRSAPANNASANKSLTDKAIETATEEKIGIPECDEVMDMLTEEANNPDDNFVAKAVKATFINKAKEGIRKSIEDNKNDKAEIAKTCKQFKEQLVKFKKEQEEKKQ